MMKTKILITDPLSPAGIEVLKQIPDVEIVERVKIPLEELKNIIKDYEVLLVRSGTKVTADVIECAHSLRFIGRAGVGLDNVDVEAATRKGIIVMNTPGGNTISTAEHTIALMLSLLRNIPQAYLSLREGKWDRKKFMGKELFGKTVGIIGLGRIGREVAKRLQAFGVKLLGYDPYLPLDKFEQLGITSTDVDTICSTADVITIHTPLTDETRYLIDENRLKKMKKTAVIINCARGGIVKEDALKKALKEGWISGAALDVYEKEPLEDEELLKIDGIIGTPHLGASTKEAQEKVAVQIAEQIRDAITGVGIFNAVNYPSVDQSVYHILKPYINLGERLGMFMSQIMDGRPKSVHITYRGEALFGYDLSALRKAILKGILSSIVTDSVNYVNAEVIAEERGLEVKEGKTQQLTDYANLIEVSVKTDKRIYYIAGSIFKKDEPRVVRIDGYDLEAVPVGVMLVTYNDDKPGLIGALGMVLGRNGINIAGMTFGREKPMGSAIMVLNLDEDVSAQVLEEVAKIQSINEVKLVKLPQL